MSLIDTILWTLLVPIMRINVCPNEHVHPVSFVALVMAAYDKYLYIMRHYG